PRKHESPKNKEMHFLRFRDCRVFVVSPVSVLARSESTARGRAVSAASPAASAPSTWGQSFGRLPGGSSVLDVLRFPRVDDVWRVSVQLEPDERAGEGAAMHHRALVTCRRVHVAQV